MENLYFKNWLEDMMAPGNQQNTQKQIASNPVLAAAATAAKTAAATAIKEGQNPVVAAKQSVVKNPNVPLNKLGALMPVSDDDKDPV